MVINMHQKVGSSLNWDRKIRRTKAEPKWTRTEQDSFDKVVVEDAPLLCRDLCLTTLWLVKSFQHGE